MAVIGKMSVVMEAATGKFTAGMGQAVKSVAPFKTVLGTLGKTMTMKVTLPLAGMAAGAVIAANTFDKTMSQITGLVGIAADEVDSMGASVLKLAGPTAKAPQELAKALFAVTSAGLRGSEAMGALDIAAKASAAGLGDTNDVALAAASSMTAYASVGMTAVEATDILTATVKQGNLAAADLAGSLGAILPIAAAAGISLADVGAATAIITRSGASAGEAITSMRAAIMAMNAPGGEAATIMEQAGLSANNLRKILKEDGLIAGLRAVEKAAQGDASAMKLMFGSSEALSGALTLLGTDAATITEVFDDVANSAGITQQAFEVAAGEGAFKFKAAMQEMNIVAIQFGQIIAPMVTAMMGLVSELMHLLTAIPKWVKIVVVALGTFLAVLGPLMAAMWAFTTPILAAKGAVFLLGMQTKFATPKILTWAASINTAKIAMRGFLVIAALTAGLAIWSMWKNSRAKEAQKYANRVNEVSEGMKRLHPEMFLVTQRMSELHDELPKSATGLEGLESILDQIAGGAAIASRAAMEGLGFEFRSLIKIMPDFNNFLTATGSELGILSKNLSTAGKGRDESAIRKALEGIAAMEGDIGLVGEQLIALKQSMPQKEFQSLVKILDDYSKAQAGSTAENEKLAKAAFNTGEAMAVAKRHLGQHGVDLVEDAIATANASDSKTAYAIELKAVYEAIIKANPELAGLVDGMDAAARAAAAAATPLGLLTTAVESVVDGVMENIEEHTSLEKAFENAGEAASEASEKIGKEVPTSIGMLTDALVTSVEEMEAWKADLETLSGQVGPALLDELAKLGPAAAPLIRDIVTATAGERAALIAAYEATGRDSVNAAENEFEEMADALTKALAPAIAEAFGLGADIMQGLAMGLDLGQIATLQKLTKFGDEMRDAMENPWFVMSPSKVTQQLGNDIMEGLYWGIDGFVPELTGLVERTMLDLVDAFDAAMFSVTLVGTALDDSVPSVREYGDQMGVLESNSISAALAQERLKAAIDAADGALEASKAATGAGTTVERMFTSISDIGAMEPDRDTGVAALSGGVSMFTEKGRENREVLRGATNDIQAWGTGLAEAGIDAAIVNRVIALQREELIKNAVAVGADEEAVRDLMKEWEMMNDIEIAPTVQVDLTPAQLEANALTKEFQSLVGFDGNMIQPTIYVKGAKEVRELKEDMAAFHNKKIYLDVVTRLSEENPSSLRSSHTGGVFAEPAPGEDQSTSVLNITNNNYSLDPNLASEGMAWAGPNGEHSVGGG